MPSSTLSDLVLPRRALLLISLASLAGCAGREGSRREGAAWSPEAEGTTIGRDLGASPPGTVAPATSLGVDLVERGARRDDAVSRANDETPRNASR